MNGSKAYLQATPQQVVIAAGDTQSVPVDLINRTIVGMMIPSNFKGATLKFYGAEKFEGPYIQFLDNYDSTKDLTRDVIPSRILTFSDFGMFISTPWVIFESDIAQDEDATFTVMRRAV